MVRLHEVAISTIFYSLSLFGVVNARLQPRASHTDADAHPSSTATSTVTVPKELTDCHVVSSELHCVAGSIDYHVHTTFSAAAIPSAFTDCHAHDDEIFCVSANGVDVEVSVVPDESDHDDHDDHDHHDHHEDSHEQETTAGQTCHFHAGVEHCTGGTSAENAPATCSRVERDYNIRLRIGLIFAMLFTSAIGVYFPIFAISFIRPSNVIFTILRQFGTGIIISTAFVHLFTHANLMFQNECLGELKYESTAAGILMAGLFLSFLVEYAGARLVQWHNAKATSKSVEDSSDSSSSTGRRFGSSLSTEMVNIYVLEAGIIFHSFLIGLTLVVSGDTFFITLFIVIVFHQFFEGLALGTRIAALGLSPAAALALPSFGHAHGHHPHSHAGVHSIQKPEETPVIESHQLESHCAPKTECKLTSTVCLRKKLFLASLFAFVTPAGMALGTGILSHFNGNDPSTIVAIGTLSAFSAGILVWVGVVEMWAQDWMMGGEMTSASPLRTVLGLVSLVTGIALMSLLGKWA